MMYSGWRGKLGGGGVCGELFSIWMLTGNILFEILTILSDQFV